MSALSGGSSAIIRSSPGVGNFNPEFFADLGMSQIVRAGGLLFMSGIVAADVRGEVPALNDFPGQIRAILNTMAALLATEGLTLANLVSTTIYTPDIVRLRENCRIMTEAFSPHPPTMTWVEVKGLASPDYLLEVVAIAGA